MSDIRELQEDQPFFRIYFAVLKGAMIGSVLMVLFIAIPMVVVAALQQAFSWGETESLVAVLVASLLVVGLYAAVGAMLSGRPEVGWPFIAGAAWAPLFMGWVGFITMLIRGADSITVMVASFGLGGASLALGFWRGRRRPQAA